MALDSGFYILGEVSIHDRSRVLGQERNALRDGAARRDRRMDHRYREVVALDYNLCTGAHARQHGGKVAERFRFRDVDHIWSAMARLYRHSSSLRERATQGPSSFLP